MTVKFEIGDWVKLRNEKDYYNVKSVNSDSGYISLEDVTGHIWEVSVSSIEKKCTNKEIFGEHEPTTADEFNKRDYGPPYGPHNPAGNTSAYNKKLSKGEKK